MWACTPASGSEDDLETDGGAFRLLLPPGEYWLTQVPPDSDDDEDTDGGSGSISGSEFGFATVKVNVGAEALEGITLKLEPPLTIGGRFVFEGGPPSPDALMHARVQLDATADGSGCQATGRTDPEPSSDGTFELYASPGTCIPTATPPPGWYLKAIHLGGADVTRRVVTLEHGRSPGEMQVIFTDQRNELSFNVTDARGAATSEYVAIVFPTDESLWLMRQVLWHAVRLHVPSVDGGAAAWGLAGLQLAGYSDFSVLPAGLIAGEYYAIAVDDAEWDDAIDPDVLRRLSRKAIRFEIGEGETRRLDLPRVDFAGFRGELT